MATSFDPSTIPDCSGDQLQKLQQQVLFMWIGIGSLGFLLLVIIIALIVVAKKRKSQKEYENYKHKVTKDKISHVGAESVRAPDKTGSFTINKDKAHSTNRPPLPTAPPRVNGHAGPGKRGTGKGRKAATSKDDEGLNISAVPQNHEAVAVPFPEPVKDGDQPSQPPNYDEVIPRKSTYEVGTEQAGKTPHQATSDTPENPNLTSSSETDWSSWQQSSSRSYPHPTSTEVSIEENQSLASYRKSGFPNTGSRVSRLKLPGIGWKDLHHSLTGFDRRSELVVRENDAFCEDD